MTDNRHHTSEERAPVIARNVKAECIRRGFEPAAWVAATLNKSLSTARRKLSGSLRFGTEEVAAIAAALSMEPGDLYKEAS